MCNYSLLPVIAISLLVSSPLNAARVKQVCRRTPDAPVKREVELQYPQPQAAGVTKPRPVRIKKVRQSNYKVEPEINLEAEVKPSAYHLDICKRYMMYCLSLNEVFKTEKYTKKSLYKNCEILTNGSSTKYKLCTLNTLVEVMESRLNKVHN